MKSRNLLNLVLLVIVLALIAITLFQPGMNEPEVVHLAKLDDGAVRHIVLQGKETIVFDKRDDHWFLSEPIKAPANDIRIKQLMEIAKAESAAQYPVKEDELAKYELDKPKATLTLGELQLIFGGSDPIDMRRYVLVGDTLHLVNDDFFHHLSAPATDYVDKKLLPENAKPTEIKFPGLKIGMGEEGRWKAEPAPENEEGLIEFLNAWQSARAIEVKKLEQPPQGDLITISFSDHMPIEFVILQREPDLVLARVKQGLQYVLASESGKQLLSIQKPEIKSESKPVANAAESAEHDEEEGNIGATDEPAERSEEDSDEGE